MTKDYRRKIEDKNGLALPGKEKKKGIQKFLQPYKMTTFPDGFSFPEEIDSQINAVFRKATGREIA